MNIKSLLQFYNLAKIDRRLGDTVRSPIDVAHIMELKQKLVRSGHDKLLSDMEDILMKISHSINRMQTPMWDGDSVPRYQKCMRIINPIDADIKSSDGAIPFLITLFTVKVQWSLKTSPNRS